MSRLTKRAYLRLCPNFRKLTNNTKINRSDVGEEPEEIPNISDSRISGTGRNIIIPK